MHSSILKSAIHWNRVSSGQIIFNRKLTNPMIDRRLSSRISTRIDSTRTFSTAGRGSPSPIHLTNLLGDLDTPINPVIHTCLNVWHVGRFRVQYDRTFRLDEFQVGAKQACIVVMKKLFKMDFDGLHGLMTPEILARLRRVIKMLSKKERAKFDIQESDTMWKPIVSTSYQQSPSGDDFFEIRLVYFWLRGLETLQKENSQLSFGTLSEVVDVVSDRFVVANVKFAKRVTPSVDTDWTITHANFGRSSKPLTK